MTAELPTTWFSEVPGSLTDSEVRLFAFLLVHQHLSAEDTVLDEWIQQALASPGSPDVGRRLANATKQRGLRCLKVVGGALAGLLGVGQITQEPAPTELMHYLIRLVIGGSKKAQTLAAFGS